LTGGEWLGSSRDREVLKHGFGLTDIVPNKAASSDALLRRGDCDVVGLVQKVEQFEPKIIAFNGERAVARVARHLKYLPPLEGPAPWTLGQALVYRLRSSSSANARGGYAAKRAKWVEFGEWAREQVSGP
jgi:hypothetical protein